MSQSKRIFNVKSPTGLKAAQSYLIDLSQYDRSVVRVMIEDLKDKRTGAQNAALHLMFKDCADLLNENGLYFIWNNVISGEQIEIPWTMEMFKERVWKDFQQTMYNVRSTTQLTTEMINEVFSVINKMFAERKIQVVFPSQFEKYLQQQKNLIR